MGGILSVALAVALTGAGDAAPADQRIQESLERVAKRRVLFGHQSVGANLLHRLARLAASHPNTIRVAELRGPRDLSAGTIAHAFVETNGDPRRKLSSFERLLASLDAAPPDIAIVKFCWADISPTTDVASLFSAYQAKLRELAARYPRTQFVHVTVPLTTVQGGAKAFLKGLLGTPPAGLLDDARREEFNALVRNAYGRAPLFDLARLESVAPDGTETTAEWNGIKSRVLAPASTTDGGHLTRSAEDRIARELVVFLAGLL
jgi:hypothetical protein